MGYEQLLALSDLQVAEIRQPKNPFSWLVTAHRAAQKTRRNPRKRYDAKRDLVRGLYHCGLEKTDVREFLQLVDAVLALSPEMEYALLEELTLYEKEAEMPYVTSFERIGRKKGREEGRQEGAVAAYRSAVIALLEDRVGAMSSDLIGKLEAIDSAEQLKKLVVLAGQAKSLDDFSAMLS